MKKQNKFFEILSGTALSIGSVIGCSCLVHSTAMAAEPARLPVIFAIDHDYQYDNPQAGIVGLFVDQAGNERTGKQGQNLKAALDFDLLSTALPIITCGATDQGGENSCATIPLADTNKEALKTILSQQPNGVAQLVRYFAMYNDERFWARLEIQEVRLKKDEVLVERPISAYYLSRLADEETKLRGEPWRGGNPSRLEAEVRTSWMELRDMWHRIEADSADGANPRIAWKTAAKVPKTQDGWAFRCRGIAGCAGQYVLKLTESRVWITAAGGPVITSLNKNQAAYGSNIAAVIYQ